MDLDNIWVREGDYNDTEHKDKELAERQREADRKVSNAEADSKKAGRELEDAKKEDARKTKERMKHEQAILTAGLEGVSEELRDMLVQQNLNLRQQISSVRGEINDVNGRISDLDDHIAEITEMFDTRLQDLFARIDDKRDRATAYCNQLQLLVADIRELHPEKLTPGEAELSYEALDYVKEDIKNTDFEAAIGVAQVHILAAVRLRERLEALNEEYVSLVRRLFEHGRQLETRFDTLKKPAENECPLPQEDAKDVIFDGRAYYWTSGILDSLEAEFSTLWTAVQNEYAVDMDLEMLRPALEQMQMMHGRVDSSVAFAYDEFYEYVRLCWLAHRVHQTLTEWDEWSFDNAEFAEGDERRTYTMRYTNGEGRTASIGLIPTRETGEEERNGNPKLGETKIGIAVFSSDGGGRAACEIDESAILSRLAEAGIKVNLLREKAGTCANASEFVQRTVLSGDRAKDGRLSAARENIQVTR